MLYSVYRLIPVMSGKRFEVIMDGKLFLFGKLSNCKLEKKKHIYEKALNKILFVFLYFQKATFRLRTIVENFRNWISSFLLLLFLLNFVLAFVPFWLRESIKFFTNVFTVTKSSGYILPEPSSRNAMSLSPQSVNKQKKHLELVLFLLIRRRC